MIRRLHALIFLMALSTGLNFLITSAADSKPTQSPTVRFLAQKGMPSFAKEWRTFEKAQKDIISELQNKGFAFVDGAEPPPPSKLMPDELGRIFGRSDWLWRRNGQGWDALVLVLDSQKKLTIQRVKNALDRPVFDAPVAIPFEVAEQNLSYARLSILNPKTLKSMRIDDQADTRPMWMLWDQSRWIQFQVDDGTHSALFAFHPEQGVSLKK
jgi:hypothetical protein